MKDKSPYSIKRMPHADEVRRAVEAYNRLGSYTEAAAETGMSWSTLKRCVTEYAPRMKLDGLDVTPEPLHPEDDVASILAVRRAEFTAQNAYREAAALKGVRVLDDKPIAIHHFGDPHLDDAGTDIIAIERHLGLINKTPGMYAANVGDTTNNWVGRLARLYGEQTTSARQAWALAEWFVGAADWLYMIGGNHDCHDTETEALTKRGWLKYDEILDDDEVLSFVPETGESEWAPILKRIVREHRGEMVRIQTNSVSLNVTPNHRILARDRDWKRDWRDWQFFTADKLPARVGLPVSGVSSNAGVSLSDDQIALAGWILTDGSIYWKGNSPKVSIYQSKAGAEIERLLAALNLEHRHTVRERDIAAVCGRALVAPPLPQHEWTLTADASRTVLEFLPRKGELPAWANELSGAQFERLLDALVAGDGCWDGGDPESKTVAALHGTKEFLSSVQSVAVQHGWYARISMARDKDYRLNLCKRDMIQFETKEATTRHQYEGTVWCLTVPRGNFMIRRDGAAHFSGNCWSGSGDPLRWMMKQVGATYRASAIRLALRFPNGREVRVNARHDFAGNSQYNPAHGVMKAVQFGLRDHVTIAGHKHTSGYGVIKDPTTGAVCHAIQVASYKVYDRYAIERGFRDQHISPCAVTVINPNAKSEASLIQVFWEPEEAADYLTHLRRKK